MYQHWYDRAVLENMVCIYFSHWVELTLSCTGRTRQTNTVCRDRPCPGEVMIGEQTRMSMYSGQGTLPEGAEGAEPYILPSFAIWVSCPSSTEKNENVKLQSEEK